MRRKPLFPIFTLSRVLEAVQNVQDEMHAEVQLRNMEKLIHSVSRRIILIIVACLISPTVLVSKRTSIWEIDE